MDLVQTILEKTKLVKLIHCNGKELTIRDTGPVIFKLTAKDTPIRSDEPWRVVDDETARVILRELLALKIYTVSK